jgi:serine/threonine protein kinase
MSGQGGGKRVWFTLPTQVVLPVFPYEYLRDDPKFSFRFRHVLGSGANGTTYLAEWETYPGSEFVVKLLNNATSGPTEEEMIRGLDQVNIIRCYGAFDAPDHRALVFEYCKGGTLAEFMAEWPGAVPRDLCLDYGGQLVRGLAYLHANGVAHRDIKPENILFVDGMRKVLRIADFGLASREKKRVHGSYGTLVYAAPEQFAATFVDPFACDVFSLALVLLEMIDGAPVIRKSSRLEEVMRMFEVGFRINTGDRTIDRILLKMLEVDPIHRATMEQIVQEEIFAAKPKLPMLNLNLRQRPKTPTQTPMPRVVLPQVSGPKAKIPSFAGSKSLPSLHNMWT